MTIFGIIAVIIVIGTIIQLKNPYRSDGNFMIIIGLGLALLGVISLCVSQIGVRGKIAEFSATKITVEAARKNEVVLESAAMQHKIIESNQWLASKQYYNKTIFDIWIPDKIEGLKLME